MFNLHLSTARQLIPNDFSNLSIAMNNTNSNIIDIDDTKKKQTDLVLNQKMILENIPDLVFIIDDKGYIKEAHTGRLNTLPHSKYEIINKNISEFVSKKTGDEIVKKIKASISEKKLQHLEFEYSNSKNKTASYEARILCIDGSRKSIVFVRDISITKQNEKIINLKNKELREVNSQLDSFVYSISHDIRGPLASLMGLVKLIGQNDSNNPIPIAEMMESSIKRLDSYVEDIINVIRNSRLKTQVDEINFDTLIRECISNFEHIETSKEIRIKQEVEQNSTFHSDLVRIKIILNNLIGNAFKYIDFNKTFPTIEIHVSVLNTGATIAVSDNGIGIKDEYLGKVFEMFFRANDLKTGSGLGLYIIKQVLQKLEGNITVGSKHGIGSVFIVTIPNLKE